MAMRDEDNAGGILTMIAMIVVAPFTIWAERHQKWARLEPAEQQLRRLGQGFALTVFTVGTPFVLFGARRIFTALTDHPADLWPAIAGWVALMAIGLTRFVVGARRLAGVRDGLRAAQSLVKLAL